MRKAWLRPGEDVEAIIYATGFYRAKAKNIIATARQLAGRPVSIDDGGADNPAGVGRKTASCVLGDIYGKPAIIVDTHFSRVVNRLSLVDTKDPVKVEEVSGRSLTPRCSTASR